MNSFNNILNYATVTSILNYSVGTSMVSDVKLQVKKKIPHMLKLNEVLVLQTVHNNHYHTYVIS